MADTLGAAGRADGKPKSLRLGLSAVRREFHGPNTTQHDLTLCWTLRSHGDEHAHHLLRSPAWVRRDLERAQDTIAALGHPPRWYRPACGQATGATLRLARAMRLRTALWWAWGRRTLGTSLHRSCADCDREQASCSTTATGPVLDG